MFVSTDIVNGCVIQTGNHPWQLLTRYCARQVDL